MLKIFLFWVDKGVTTFRVDNPHTKPVPFWEWVIGEVHRQHPEVIFLAEAFTKPKMMRLLAKVGFAQSYTYFTWRNHKHDLTEYVSELTAGEMKEYFTGNFFANTPDILPPILQFGGRPAFIMRAVLAATLSSVYGIYSGYELCENEAIPGKEEYLDSEKYEIKVRDWKAPGNIVDHHPDQPDPPRVACPADLQQRAVPGNREPHILAYAKMTEDRSDIIVCVVNLDPFHKHYNDAAHVPLGTFGIDEDEQYQAHDLLSDERYRWRGPTAYVELTRAPRWRTSSRSAAGRTAAAGGLAVHPAGGSPGCYCGTGVPSPAGFRQSSAAARELHVLSRELAEFDAHRLHLPNLVAILANRPIGREEPGTCNVENGHSRPVLGIQVGLPKPSPDNRCTTGSRRAACTRRDSAGVHQRPEDFAVTLGEEAAAIRSITSRRCGLAS
jgi:hypothetical protein